MLSRNGYNIVTVPENVRHLLAGAQDFQGNPVRDLAVYQQEWKRTLHEFAGTLLHELTHASTGFTDVSREFESALTDLIGNISSVCLAGE